MIGERKTRGRKKFNAVLLIPSRFLKLVGPNGRLEEIPC